MSAISERRFVLEGWAYTPSSGEWVGPYWGEPRFPARNDRLFADPSLTRLDSFLKVHPASWIFLDKRLDPDLQTLGSLAPVHREFSSGHYVIYHIGG